MAESLKQTINVAACADATYAPYLGVMLVSLLQNTTEAGNCRIFVIDGGLGPTWAERLVQLGAKYGTTVDILQPEQALPSNLPTFGYLKAATYLRLTIPASLPAEVRKVLYLDCDLIVRRDIKDLFRIELNGFALGAVPDVGIENLYFGRKLKRRLNMDWHAVYFNAGVLLLDLGEIRRTEFFQQALRFLMENPGKIRCADQDGLNAVANGRFKALAETWNVQSFGFRTGRFVEAGGAESDFAIVHFCDEEKPWDEEAIHPFKQEFARYAGDLEWFAAVRPARTPFMRLADSARTFLVSIGLRRLLYRLREAYKYEAPAVLGKYYRHPFSKYAFYLLYSPGRWFLERLNLVYDLVVIHGARGDGYAAAARFARVAIRALVPRGILDAWDSQLPACKRTCACCRNRTIRTNGNHEPSICPVCSWEEDPALNAHEASRSNGVCLAQAQETFQKKGSYHERFLSVVRSAATSEKTSLPQQCFDGG